MLLSPKSEYLISENGKRIRENALRRALYRICKNLNIPRRSPHSIRRTYASILLDSDIDEGFAQEQMGHSDIETTRRYYYYCRSGLEEKKSKIEKAIDY